MVSSSLLHVLYSHKYFFKLCRFSFSYMQQKLSVMYLHEYKHERGEHFNCVSTIFCSLAFSRFHVQMSLQTNSFI